MIPTVFQSGDMGSSSSVMRHILVCRVSKKHTYPCVRLLGVLARHAFFGAMSATHEGHWTTYALTSHGDNRY